ncbi:MAG: substrate-binding domain-containing protein [Candidatus Coproplasma sp.]
MTKMKKIALGAVAMCMAASVCAFAAVGCSNNNNDANSSITKAVSRESGSGTRGAFEELVKTADGDLKGVEYAACVSTSNSTDAVGSAVAQRYDTLGYMSMGSVSKYTSIQAVSLEGVEPTTENVANGTYKLARPFNIIYKQSSYDNNDLIQNFICFIESQTGQSIISSNGYVTVPDLTVQNYTAYSGTKTTLSIGGSSSVTPLMNKLADEYKEVNPNITVSVNQSDSGTGITQAQSDETGNYIGMASRDLKSTETGVVSRKIAVDGIAVVVKSGSWLSNVTLEQLYNLYKNGTAIEKTAE